MSIKDRGTALMSISDSNKNGYGFWELKSLGHLSARVEGHHYKQAALMGLRQYYLEK